MSLKSSKQSSEIWMAAREGVANLFEQFLLWESGSCSSSGLTVVQVKALLKSDDAQVATLIKMSKILRLTLGELLDMGKWSADLKGVRRRVSSLRIQKDLTQKSLAAISGVSPKFIAQVENRHRRYKMRFRLSFIEKLAKGLGVAVPEILAKKKKKRPVSESL